MERETYRLNLRDQPRKQILTTTAGVARKLDAKVVWQPLLVSRRSNDNTKPSRLDGLRWNQSAKRRLNLRVVRKNSNNRKLRVKPRKSSNDRKQNVERKKSPNVKTPL